MGTLGLYNDVTVTVLSKRPLHDINAHIVTTLHGIDVCLAERLNHWSTFIDPIDCLLIFLNWASQFGTTSSFPECFSFGINLRCWSILLAFNLLTRCTAFDQINRLLVRLDGSLSASLIVPNFRSRCHITLTFNWTRVPLIFLGQSVQIPPTLVSE